LEDLSGKRFSLFLVFVQEDVDKGDLEIAEEVSYNLTDPFEVVVD
jgi:hypothetical protein